VKRLFEQDNLGAAIYDIFLYGSTDRMIMMNVKREYDNVIGKSLINNKIDQLDLAMDANKVYDELRKYKILVTEEISNAEAKQIGQELRKVLEPIFRKHRVRLIGLKYDTDFGEISILYDTPREIRHPDEVADWQSDYAQKLKKQFDGLEDDLWPVIDDFEKRFPDYQFGPAGNVSGSGIISI
jgi:hypothetical protein